MRNLKKVLSLSLALVMLLGMMVVGAGAAEFKDAGSIKNTEAVDVVSGIGVLLGDEKGNFNPEGTLTRAEAAVVIAKLDLGESFGNLETTNASTFTDVPANHWAKAYIDYCAARGLIAGDGAGKFMPNNEVSGVAFALMVSRVLGYEDKAESVGGAEWEVKAAALARKAGLTKDVSIGSRAMTRDEMAQLTFNALKANMVEYKNPGTEINTGTGSIVIGGTPAEPKGAGSADYGTGDSILQLCEEKFPKLELDSEPDAYGRPANVWSYGVDNTISTSAQTATHTLEGGYKGKKVYSTIGKTAAGYDADNWTVYVNGKTGTGDFAAATFKGKVTAANTDDFLGTGAVTEIYVDNTAESVTVCVINTYFGKVNKVVTKDDKTTVTITKLTDGAPTPTTFETDAFEKGDYVIYTVGGDGTTQAIETMTAAESVTGKITAKSSSYLRMDGEKYDYNYLANDGDAAIGEAVIYLDAAGNVLYIGEVEAAAAQYLFVKGADKYFNTLSVRALFPDGTTKEVELDGNTEATFSNGSETIVAANGGTKLSAATDENLTKLAGKVSGKVYSYTVSDEKYKLEPAGTVVANKASASANGEFQDVNITKGKAALYNAKAFTGGSLGSAADSSVVANNSTVYVVTATGKTYTGFRNVPSMSGVSLAYVAEDGVASLVFITNAGTAVDDPNAFFFYVADTSEYEDGDGFRVLNAVYVDGEKTEVTVTSGVVATITKPGLYKATTVNDKEQVSAASAVIGWKEDINSKNIIENGHMATVAANGVLKLTGGNGGADPLDKQLYTYDDETLFVTIAKDGSVSSNKGEAGDIARKNTPAVGDSLWYVYVSEVKSSDSTIAKTVYVAEKAAVAPAALTSVTLGQGSDQKPTLTTETDVTSNEAGTTDWATGSKDKIKITVVAGSGTTATVKINNVDYTSGDDYTIAAKADLTVKITVTDGTTGVKNEFTYTVKVA